MARPRFDKLDSSRQDEIFEAAAAEFSERGYEAASVNRILDRAGMSKGSLYYYFEDKGDLFSTVMERATTRLVKLVGGIDLAGLTAETFWPSIEAMVRRSAQQLESNTWYIRLARSLYRLWSRSGDRGPSGKFFAWLARWTESVLRRGQELGVVRDDLPLELLATITLSLGQVTDHWMLEHWDELGPTERETMVTAQMALFRRLLAPEES